MSKKRFILLVLIAIVAAYFVVRWLRPTPPVAAPPPPPAAEPAKPALQADAEGRYVPGYAFAVGRYRFTGFSLRPDALVTLAQSSSGSEDVAICLDARISATAIHLRCDYPQLGSVTIEGRFLTRVLTSRLDAPVVSAVVTVRDQNGEILYNARDSFTWQPGS